MPARVNQVARGKQLVASAGKSLKVLLLGDIMGKIGRRAVTAALPALKKRYKPTLIVANAENLAHGLGVTESSLQEMKDAGVDVFTSGNNIWSKDGIKLLTNDSTLLRPANYPAATPGRGDHLVTIGGKKILVLNLQGRLYMHQQLDDPMTVLDALLTKYAKHKLSAIVVDYHAEATSEKAALAWHADGRVSAVVGTHTHVQTADERLLPKRTAFISDLGMCGAFDSIIGTSVEHVLQHQRTQIALKHEIPETGEALVCGAVVTVDPKNARATAIERFQEMVDVQANGKAQVRKGVRTA